MAVTRCAWVTDDLLYKQYHDEEWGNPVYDDQVLFEFLCLEGAQAGLSWLTILKKRAGYREAFYNFKVEQVATMTDEDLESLRQDARIVRNCLKIYSCRTNAQAFMKVQQEFGSFANYLWGWVQNSPVINNPKTLKEVPVTTNLSDCLSKDLKKRGFKFVGSTIIYAYLQAVGVVNDHTTNCWCSAKAKLDTDL